VKVRILKDGLLIGNRWFTEGEIATREHAHPERLRALVEAGHAAHAFAVGPVADDPADDDDDADDLADDDDDEDEAPAPAPALPAPRRGRKPAAAVEVAPTEG
jgi:hypothetical protein